MLDAFALEGEGTGRPTERPAHPALKGVAPWYSLVTEPVRLTGKLAIDVNGQYAIVSGERRCRFSCFATRPSDDLGSIHLQRPRYEPIAIGYAMHARPGKIWIRGDVFCSATSGIALELTAPDRDCE